ncbi:MAG: class I SAM-dependent methyltransferase [Erythrobacter sp.]
MIEVLNEHLEYLSLPGRSETYKAAISQAVSQGDLVADLGCGVGVLGIFCLEAGAAEVWGIDSSDAIHLAQEVVQKADLCGVYHCIADSTFRAALPQPVDLIICDHIGFFGFDYGIIELLRDARQRLLKPGGIVIPQAIDLMVAGVFSDACRDRVTAWQGDQIPPEFRWLDEYQRNSKHHHNFLSDELVSQPAPLGHIDLEADDQQLFVFKTNLIAERTGRFDGIAGWFDCLLYGDIRMTNSPVDDASIKRPQAFLPVATPFDVEAGDVIAIAIRFQSDGSMIAWDIKPPNSAPTQKLSTWKGTILTPADLVNKTATPLRLSGRGEAETFILSLIDGQRTAEDITAIVLSQRPAMFPSQQAIRDFVRDELARACKT